MDAAATTAPVRPRRRAKRRAPPTEQPAPASVAAASAEKPPYIYDGPANPEPLPIAHSGSAAPVSDMESARRRAAEIMEHGLAMDEGTDKFEFDRSIIPDGWDYAWKRLTTMGQEDPAYQVQLTRNGWEPVPASRHPEMMPQDWKQGTITRDGQILMQRPMEITDRSRLIERRRAMDQVRVKEAQLNSAPNGTFERGTHPGAPVRVSKGYEPIPIPVDK